LRILHIDKFHPPRGGVGSYVRALAAAQQRLGHEVLHFGCPGQEGPSSLPEFVDFTQRPRPWMLPRMIHSAHAAEALRRFLRTSRVDVAHLHNVYHHLTPAILPVLARRRIGIVMTLHDYRLACPTRHFLRDDGRCMRCWPNRFHHAAGPRCAGLRGAALAVESFCQRAARRYFRPVAIFLCPTTFMRRVMVRAGMPAGKARVVPNPVEPILLPPDVPRAERELLCVGRLEEGKGCRIMIELAKCLPDAHVTLVGSGPLLDPLRDEAAQSGLRNVTFAGEVEHGRMGHYYARAAAVVLTSRWMENCPQVMLEAMSAERLVIAPDQPPLREFIRDGLTGRLFAQDDADCLTGVVREVLGDAARRQQMARAAKNAAARHDPARVAAEIDALYREAISRCESR